MERPLDAPKRVGYGKDTRKYLPTQGEKIYTKTGEKLALLRSELKKQLRDDEAVEDAMQLRSNQDYMDFPKMENKDDISQLATKLAEKYESTPLEMPEASDELLEELDAQEAEVTQGRGIHEEPQKKREIMSEEEADRLVTAKLKAANAASLGDSVQIPDTSQPANDPVPQKRDKAA